MGGGSYLHYLSVIYMQGNHCIHCCLQQRIIFISASFMNEGLGDADDFAPFFHHQQKKKKNVTIVIRGAPSLHAGGERPKSS